VSRHAALTLVVGTALLLASGCSDGSKREPVFPVAGKLTYKGKPMSGAHIDFLPLNNPKPEVVAGGIVGDDGSYQLSSYDPEDGSPAGEFIVTIVWPKPGPALDEAGTLPDQLKGVYATRTSKLRAHVKQEANVIDFHLK
jgi:hypothetical protein